MSEALLIAIIQMVTKVGFEATAAFLRNRGATIDDAIAALEAASSKSLQQYKDEDKVLSAVVASPVAETENKV